ncbi:hypothetical protein RhiirA5_463207 [Rhizophagus irregularis]|uniref:Uncharacterized protein n=1 Tax=Rhizophagus irregularis TaxID=588596 RepID=A0A2N0SA54_9GLOM|nr:hypothetical protein RhiirA5_463207 [Rhizophagus irregularis]PKC72445.1 hypothetical protein RhiirA1_531210 [Rhizophagus irregularis]GBC20144.2 hypothetical protein GLOIN_2v1624649 [Rhizophagus irregularis DAOM 181602=DAOM 197198]CAB5351565.1 unnamed protein product [Rhizophagus irregularis]
MSYYKLPPNYYLQFYPPPPHPPPPPAFQTTTQKFLRFHDFHHTHFIQNRNFFHALNSTTPWWSWKVEEEGVEEGSRYQQQQPEEYENYEYQEEYYEEREEEKAEGVEFVLSEEAIAMFRFSELRKQQLAEEISKSKKKNNNNDNNDNNDNDDNLQSQASSTDDNYLDTEPDPSIIPSFHNQPCVESKELYGDSCTIINTLEAAVNSTFVQSFNVSNKATNNSRRDEEVVYWPVLPLRFV